MKVIFLNCLLTGLYEDAGLFQRLSLIEKEFPGANIILHKAGKMPEVGLYIMHALYKPYIGLFLIIILTFNHFDHRYLKSLPARIVSTADGLTVYMYIIFCSVNKKALVR